MSDEMQKTIFSKNLNHLLHLSGKTQKEVADAIGVIPTTFNSWCQGISLPRMGKVQALADYFGVSKSDLIDDQAKDETPYYINDDAKEYAQFLFENPEYRVLFSAVRKVSKDDLDMVRQIIDKFKGG